jgi:hypothetical protein
MTAEKRMISSHFVKRERLVTSMHLIPPVSLALNQMSGPFGAVTMYRFSVIEGALGKIFDCC